MMRRALGFGVALVGVLACARAASAFCGFYVSGASDKLYNNATQVVLMREGTRTVMSIENNYQGPPERFAMVVPVPVILQKENVKTLPHDVFDRIEQLDAPRLVEYWEQDPCAPPHRLGLLGGAGGARRFAPAHEAADRLGVTVEAQFVVGEYEVVILSAKDSTGLDTWLRQEKYAIPAGAEPVLRPYVQAGMRFFVAKVDPQKVTFKDGMATLSPLRFFYDAETFSLPVRLGLLNARDSQDLIVHILARGQRYEVANYANVTIPTNLDVSPEAKERFPSLYNALFDDTLEKHPKAVVTEYAWDAGTCDPCPGPALTMSDLTTLGADALPAPAGDAGAPGPRGRGRFGRRVFPSGFVVTRLHARYDRASLGEDLVFRAAPPITGGREIRAGAALEQGASPSSFNNFQARYAIRHPWTGPIACEHPVRGIWGGPPSGASTGGQSPVAATNLAFAARDKALLASFRLPSAAASATPATSAAPSAAAPAPSSSAGGAAAPRPGGCGSCSSAGTSGGAPWGLGLGAVAFASWLRARRRKTHPGRRP